LVEAGIIQQTLLSSGERHFYEPAFERPHHDHLICIACGKVVEFEFETFEVLQRDIAKRYGFELTAHVHELLGRCAGCRRANKAKPPDR
jgi:Fur family ferric uptake transcriptional regulator